MRTKFLVFAVLAFALILSACGPTTINQAAPDMIRTMNVNGVGQVDLTPDIAYIYIGVHDESPTASEAVDANKAHTTAVINAIKKAGVDAKDIRTTNFSIYPSQQYAPDGTISGTVYMVDNSVYVTVRNLDILGRVQRDRSTLLHRAARRQNRVHRRKRATRGRSSPPPRQSAPTRRSGSRATPSRAARRTTAQPPCSPPEDNPSRRENR